MAEVPKTLQIKSIADAVEEAKALINAERSGRINGLFTRWKGINKAKFKYWRFGNVTGVGGMSGSGKSAILNMIEDDFTNPDLNPTYLQKFNPNTNSFLWDGEKRKEHKFTLLAFKYEMSAADEVLRNLSGKVQKSYAHLLSAQNQALPSLEESYNRIDDVEFNALSLELDKLKDRPIKYIENAGNLDQLYNTCAKQKEEDPTKQLIVTIDHTLLSKKLNEKDDLELTSQTAKCCIALRKVFNAIVIPILQMNGEIEKPLRRDKLELHFPVKTDLHCGNQIFWACDDLVIFHRPELLHIEKYGKLGIGGKSSSLHTKGLIHGAWIKSRYNRTGNIWFRENFKEGTINQIDPETVRWKPSDAQLHLPD